MTPPPTPREQALKKAYKMFKEAWTLGLNLHDVFVAAYKAPADWNTLDLSTRFGGVPAGTHYADVLPFTRPSPLTTSQQPSWPPRRRPSTASATC